LPREKSGVDSVPWRMLTAWRGDLKVPVLDVVGSGAAGLAEDGVVSLTRVVAMAAMLEVLRKALRVEVMIFSVLISAKGSPFRSVSPCKRFHCRMKAYRMASEA